MSTIRGFSHSKYAGLLPTEPSDEFVRPAALKKDQSPNRRRSLGKRALRTLAEFLIMLCVFLATILAWRSYGNIATQMTADVYRQLSWLAPQAQPVAQSASNMVALGAPATPFFDQQQLSVNFDELRQSIDRIVAGQDEMTRSIDQIAASIAAGQEQMTPRSDQTPTSIGQPPSARASGVTVESRDDATAPASTARLNIKPTEAKPPEKQLSAGSGHDPSCFPSASAVLQNHPEERPSWTLRAPGHEGTRCWYPKKQTENHHAETGMARAAIA